MEVVLCIGFHYQGALPGLIDIDRIVSSNSSLECVVITDIKQTDRNAISLMVACDGSDYDLYTSVKNYKQYYYAINWGDIKAVLSLYRNRKVYLYYSGHNTTNGFKLPSEEIVSWNSLLEVLKPISMTAILDCCYAPSLSLPFIYTKTGWKYTKGKSNKPYVVLAASPPNEVANSSSSGSPFTAFVCNFMSLPKFNSIEDKFPHSKIYSYIPIDQ